MLKLIKQTPKWDIVESPVFGANGVQSKNYKQILRGDTFSELAIVSDTYKPISKKSFFETISEISEISGYAYEGYAELFGGNRLLAWLKAPENKKICGYDTENYLMFGTAHDGTSALMVGTTNYMIRCANQFSYLHRNNIFKISHTKTSTDKVSRLSKSYEKYRIESDLMYQKIEQFQDVKVSPALIKSAVKELTNEGKAQKVTAYTLQVQSDLNESITRECGQLGYNLFGLFNGFTHYTTHKATNHRGKEPVFGNAHGKMAAMNKKAIEMCMELLNTAPKTYALQ